MTSPVKVPWTLQGAFILSLLGACIQGSVLHSDMDVKVRLETAFTGQGLFHLSCYKLLEPRSRFLIQGVHVLSHDSIYI